MVADALIAAGVALQDRTPPAAPQIYDLRIDHAALSDHPSPQMEGHVRQELLMRTYQNRFVLLPQDEITGSVVEMLHARYDPRATHALDANRAALEEALIEPAVSELRPEIAGQDVEVYIAGMLDGIRNGPPSAFLSWLDTQPRGEAYYRNFLIQSSADLLAEASASAMGVIGEFGAPQSALFRILIDEFGYGTHDKKHSVLFRRTLRGFGLNEEYNGYWPVFDTEALHLHNVIHYLFQSPRNLFRQIGFLLYAETSYQVSTGQHYQYLKRHHPAVDGTYFGEHAHIDIHHSRMVIDEVVKPLVARFGPEVGEEVILGAELTRRAFAAADTHALSVCQTFEAARLARAATFAAPRADAAEHPLVTPDTAEGRQGRVQVGGIGVLHEVADFAGFPGGATGRLYVDA